MTPIAESSSPPHSTRTSWKWWLLPPVIALAAVACYVAIKGQGRTNAASHAEEASEHKPVTTGLHVDVVKPVRATLERKTVQPGNAIAWESIDIMPEVSGIIAKQPVDYGSVVKKGDLLVSIHVPELKAEMDKYQAGVQLAEAQVEEGKANLETAKADLIAAGEKISEAQARLKASRAALTFRQKQRDRYRELLDLKSIDARLVDEQEDRYEAAMEAVNAADAVLRSSRAQKLASEARVDQAKAMLTATRRKVGVAKGEADHAKALVDFATIRAPFDGIITKRNFFPGHFVRSATGTQGLPLLQLQATNKVRMVVAIPDRDVPYCNEGDEAHIVFDAIPHRDYKARVSRVAGSENSQTKTMRCEIDIANQGDEIRQGMYGTVTVVLVKIPNAMTIPTSALVGSSEGKKASVYVVRDGKARLVSIRTGLDNGLRVEVKKGLSMRDEVVIRASGTLSEGAEVDVTPVQQEANHK